RVHLRGLQVRQIASKLNARLRKPRHRFCGIPDTVYCHAALWHRGGWSDQELLQFPRALFVTPVPYPHYIGVLLHGQRTEMRRIRSFLEVPCPLDAETVCIDTPYGFAECEHTVKLMQRQAKNLLRSGICAMMRVVKQSPEAERLFQLQNG